MTSGQRWTFRVEGVPVQQGSKIAGVTKSGRPYMRESSDRKLKPWRAAVTAAARAAYALSEPLDQPVELSVAFTFPRVASDPERVWHRTYPDLSKLVRAIEDAITDAGVWKDDARVAAYGPTTARHGDDPGAVITIRTL